MHYVALFILIIAGLTMCGGGSDSTPKTAAELRTERVERHFSAWSGAHTGLERAIKASMNDPGSYEHVETRYSDNGNHLTVRTRFRGKNAFGGVVVNEVVARVDLDGNVIEIH